MRKIIQRFYPIPASDDPVDERTDLDVCILDVSDTDKDAYHDEPVLCVSVDGIDYYVPLADVYQAATPDCF